MDWREIVEGEEWTCRFMGNDLLIRRSEVKEGGHQMWDWFLNGKKMEVASSSLDVEWQQQQMMQNVKIQMTGYI